MIVVDASVAIDFLLGPGSEAGDSLAEYLRRGELVCAPHLLDAEVGQALRRYVLHGDLAPSEAMVLVTDLGDIPLRRYPHAGLVARALELLSNVTVYDGIYLALAEALQCPLLTADAALRYVPGCRAVVEVARSSP